MIQNLSELDHYDTLRKRRVRSAGFSVALCDPFETAVRATGPEKI